MTRDTLGTFEACGLMAQLYANTQGTSKAVFPCMWELSKPLLIAEISIYVPDDAFAGQHSFSFFKHTPSDTTGTIFGAVTVAIDASAPVSGSTVLTIPVSLLGQTDWVTVRHDTNGQDGDESVLHVSPVLDEGDPIFAMMTPV